MPFLRSRFYELFIFLHSLAGSIAISLHIGYNSPTKMAFGCIHIGCLTTPHLVQCIMMLHHKSRCTVVGGNKDVGCLSIQAQVGQPGQYWLVTVPEHSYQTHPYFIAWKTDTEMFFLVETRAGFSKFLTTLGPEKPVTALHGPFGCHL